MQPYRFLQPSRFARAEMSLRTNAVLRHTYMLLAGSLLCTSLVAWASLQFNWAPPGLLLSLAGTFGLLIAIMLTRESPVALLFVFAWTAFWGWELGPLLSHYIKAIPDGASIIMTAFGVTGGTFVGLSGFVLVTGRRFNYLHNFLFAGLLVAVILSLVSIFVHMTALTLVISAIMVVVSTGYILYDTGEIVNGGQTSPVMATVSLYLDLLNLFLSVLRLLSANRD